MPEEVEAGQVAAATPEEADRQRADVVVDDPVGQRRRLAHARVGHEHEVTAIDRRGEPFGQRHRPVVEESVERLQHRLAADEVWHTFAIRLEVELRELSLELLEVFAKPPIIFEEQVRVEPFGQAAGGGVVLLLVAADGLDHRHLLALGRVPRLAVVDERPEDVGAVLADEQINERVQRDRSPLRGGHKELARPGPNGVEPALIGAGRSGIDLGVGPGPAAGATAWTSSHSARKRALASRSLTRGSHVLTSTRSSRGDRTTPWPMTSLHSAVNSASVPKTWPVPNATSGARRGVASGGGRLQQGLENRLGPSAERWGDQQLDDPLVDGAGRVAAVEVGGQGDQRRELHQRLDHVLQPHELPEGVAVVGIGPNVVTEGTIGEGDREREARHDLIAPCGVDRAGGGDVGLKEERGLVSATEPEAAGQHHRLATLSAVHRLSLTPMEQTHSSLPGAGFLLQLGVVWPTGLLVVTRTKLAAEPRHEVAKTSWQAGFHSSGEQPSSANRASGRQ